MFLKKKRNISSEIKLSKVTDYAALIQFSYFWINFWSHLNGNIYCNAVNWQASQEWLPVLSTFIFSEVTDNCPNSIGGEGEISMNVC